MLGVLGTLETSVVHVIKHRQKIKLSTSDFLGSGAGFPTALQQIISKSLTRTSLVWRL